MPVHSCVLVMCSCGSVAEAERIASLLVEQRLAACVQVQPVTSTYRWQGQVMRDAEQLLLIKTVAARLPEVEATIKQAHSYDLPEISAVPISGGSAEYLDWIQRESGL